MRCCLVVEWRLSKNLHEMSSVDECRSAIFILPNESIIYDVLHEVHEKYKPIHTYMSIIMCAIGAVCNFCNIVVLTRLKLFIKCPFIIKYINHPIMLNIALLPQFFFHLFWHFRRFVHKRKSIEVGWRNLFTTKNVLNVI